MRIKLYKAIIKDIFLVVKETTLVLHDSNSYVVEGGGALPNTKYTSLHALVDTSLLPLKRRQHA